MEAERTEHEWIALVTQAAAESQFAEARELLHRCMQQHPGSARGHYLLAVECAEERDTDEALRHFAAALKTEPRLHEARLQWALLLLTLARDAEALDVLQAFDHAATHPAIQAFQAGLRCIARGEAQEALARLHEGLEMQHPNAPLMQDMRVLARHIESRARGEAESPGGEAPQPQAATAAHYLVKVYGDAGQS
jgi:Flp pilus assembly protein TadD